MKGWKKVPSVTEGGRPYFYVKDGLTVMWDQRGEGWRIWANNNRDKSGLYRTPQEAMKVANIKGRP
jgi:hypothetical protein